ncbi:MerR family transcriptional regulator (plasmid) [Leptolyngbya sp. NIES-3755]|nr:MerR family transcriptional regulator [Leptolyngbya sp. NIES-3755]
MNAVVEQQGSTSEKLIKIGELAAQTGVSVPTIRYYESLGLLNCAQRSESGYRYYDRESVKQLIFIKKAQSLQFSLSEIQQLLGVRRQGSPACPMVKGLLKRKIADLEKQIRVMTNLKQELEAYQAEWNDRPIDELHNQQLCSLIEEVSQTLVVEDEIGEA